MGSNWFNHRRNLLLHQIKEWLLMNLDYYIHTIREKLIPENKNEVILIGTTIFGIFLLYLGLNMFQTGRIKTTWTILSIGLALALVYPLFLFIYFQRK